MYESGENYLETILLLTKRQTHVRSIDVANELGFSRPSISRAMGILAESGYITIEQGHILLTEAGKEKASEIYERHCLITAFLQQTLGLDDMTADADACRIEHVISEETFRRIKQVVQHTG